MRVKGEQGAPLWSVGYRALPSKSDNGEGNDTPISRLLRCLRVLRRDMPHVDYGVSGEAQLVVGSS